MNFEFGKDQNQADFLTAYAKAKAQRNRNAEPDLISKEYLDSFEVRPELRGFAPDQDNLFLGTTVSSGKVYAVFGNPTKSLNKKAELLDHVWKDYGTLCAQIDQGERKLDTVEAVNAVLLRNNLLHPGGPDAPRGGFVRIQSRRGLLAGPQ